MPRLRIRYITWPHPGLILTDTPRPHCPDCLGDGGWHYDVGDPDTGECADTVSELCTCWNPDRRWLLLPLPHRRTGTAYSDEPPF